MARAARCARARTRAGSCTAGKRIRRFTTRSACAITTPNGASAWGAKPSTRTANDACQPRRKPQQRKAARANDASACLGRRQMDRTAIEELVYKSCMLLDEHKYKEYLDLCGADFRYTIT